VEEYDEVLFDTLLLVMPKYNLPQNFFCGVFFYKGEFK